MGETPMLRKNMGETPTLRKNMGETPTLRKTQQGRLCYILRQLGGVATPRLFAG